MIESPPIPWKVVLEFYTLAAGHVGEPLPGRDPVVRHFTDGRNALADLSASIDRNEGYEPGKMLGVAYHLESPEGKRYTHDAAYRLLFGCEPVRVDNGANKYPALDRYLRRRQRRRVR